MSQTVKSQNNDFTLVANNITKNFGGLRAVNQVSLELAIGEILGLIGPNGSGKTTFINVVTGNLDITEGEVWIGDTNITGWPPHKIPFTGIARTFQVVRLFKALTVLENVEVAAVSVKRLSRKDAKERARNALELVGLTRRADVQAGTLPYGEERELEIARALVTDPKFLLLDEPGAGLNEDESETLLKNLARLPGEIGCGMLVVDHDMRLIMRLCDRIHVLDHGSTIAQGTPEEVRNNPEVKKAYLGSAALED
jgi:branched-chain amino acid transport system ATP-binding protein